MKAGWSIDQSSAVGLSGWQKQTNGFVCSADRVCQPDKHNNMKDRIYDGEKNSPYNRNPTKYATQDVCNIASFNGKNECTSRRFTQPLAKEYCEKVGMRLCDVNELLFSQTRYCSSHYYHVWTKTPCKNIDRTNGNDDDNSGYTKIWDPDYFWVVQQYPLGGYSESGDRLCMKKDSNLYQQRTNNAYSYRNAFQSVSCCGDTRHSPRWNIRYDDDNWKQ